MTSISSLAGFVKSHVHGTASLSSAFWTVGVAGGVATGLVTLALAATAERLGVNPHGVGALLVLAFAYSVFSHVCMWRCSYNTKSAFFSRFVRFLVQWNAAVFALILFGLVTVLVLRVIG